MAISIVLPFSFAQQKIRYKFLVNMFLKHLVADAVNQPLPLDSTSESKHFCSLNFLALSRFVGQKLEISRICKSGLII
jgi:hypothetical protein